MRRKYLGPLLIGAMVVFTLVAFPFLPERIPTHWNIRGAVDGWSSRWPGAFFVPAMALGLWLLLQLLPRLDPRRENYERFEDTYWLVIGVLIGFLALVQLLSLGSALGWPVDAPRMIIGAVGILLVALGNSLPRIRSNWWMGIRTPWTLENERVWRETHRLGGKTFVAAGLITILAAFLPGPIAFWVVMPAIMAAGFIPLVYSYVIWRRERGET
jgi:uncharacterized membrane protein